jgi:hypothetical protein
LRKERPRRSELPLLLAGHLPLLALRFLRELLRFLAKRRRASLRLRRALRGAGMPSGDVAVLLSEYMEHTSIRRLLSLLQEGGVLNWPSRRRSATETFSNVASLDIQREAR